MSSCRNSIGCRNASRKIGVILLQLGTPDAPTPSALRRYLREFFLDPRVIEMSRWLWYPILFGIILITRPARSAKLYKRIWGKDGSPLLTTTISQAKKLQEYFNINNIEGEVTFGMRYGNPSIKKAVKELTAKGCRRIVAIPLYPQYASATTGSVYDALYPAILDERWVPTVRVVEPFYDHDGYQAALATSIQRKLDALPWKPEKIIFSYHGIPKRYAKAGDPYCCMCIESTAITKKRLNLPDDVAVHTFQSRFGKEPWLTPFTDVTIENLAKEGIKKIAVVCPGFTTDCLETLDEIANEGKHAFVEAGGEDLVLIPCLNDSPEFIEFLAQAVLEISQDWRKKPQQSIEKITCLSAVNE